VKVNHDDATKAKHLCEIRENLGRLSKKGAGLPDDVAMVRQNCEVCVGFPTKLRADLDRDKDYWKPDVDL